MHLKDVSAGRRESGSRHRTVQRPLLIAGVALSAPTALALFVVTLLDGVLVAPGSSLEVLLRVTTGIAAGACVTSSYLLLVRVLTDGDGHGTVTEPVNLERGAAALPDSQAIDRRVRQFHARHLNEAAQLFTAVLLDRRYWLKLEEFVTIADGRARSRSKAQYQFRLEELRAVATRHREQPHGTQARLLLPLMVIRKGELLDDLDIVDNAGNRLPVLSLDDRLAAVSITLAGLYAFTFLSTTQQRDDFVERLGAVRAGTAEIAADDHHLLLFRELERQVCLTTAVTAQSVRDYFDAACREHGVSPVEDHAAELREFCVALAEHYILIIEAPLPDGCSVYVEYSRSRGLDGEPGHDGSRARHRLRRFFGLEPTAFRLPVNPTGLFTNYHAELHVQAAGQYVWRQLVLFADDRPVPADRDGSTTGSAGTRITLRADSAAHPHLYLNASRAGHPGGNLRWFVELSEIPPGALAPVFAMAASATLIFGTFAFLVPTLQAPNGTFMIEADAAALIVAVPLFTLTVFGYSLERMLRSSLVAVFGFAVTGVLVLAASISLLTADPALVSRATTVFGSPFYTPLLACTLVSLSVTTFVLLGWTFRLRRYVDRDRGERVYHVPMEGSHGQRES
jgi:hypothetical protein